jgi:cytochrome c peroxidase
MEDNRMNRVRIGVTLGGLLLAALGAGWLTSVRSDAADDQTTARPPVRRTLRLPATPYNYAKIDLPAHFKTPAVRRADNTPTRNPVTDAGATLGRVLFYDTQLSANNTTSCASCHEQKHAFATAQRFNKGFAGKELDRNAMALVNLRYYARGRFFWDERARSLEQQVLMPIQSKTELGQELPKLIKILEADKNYPELFRKAFGDTQITQDRVARALAQFLRSLVSYQSKFDEGLAKASSVRASFSNFTAQENQGKSLFLRNCATCHMPRGQEALLFMNRTANNGLDADSKGKDGGVGDITLRASDVGRFKSPSLRNVEYTAPYMHDGRFSNLEEVVDHYSKNVKFHANVDRRVLRRRNFTDSQKAALVAFLKTLSDHKFMADPKFSDPFRVTTDVAFRGFDGRRGRGGFGGRGGRGGRGPGFPAGLSVDQIVERIMAYDKKKVGKVTKADLPERMQHLVALGDTNKDGALDKEEVKKLATRLANQDAFRGLGGRRGRGFRGGPGDGPNPVASALREVKLYEEQKKKVEAIRTADQNKVRAVLQKARAGDLDPAKVREELNKARKDLLKEMKAALTGEQFEQFEKALERAGPPFPAGGPRGRGFPGDFGGPPDRGFRGRGPDPVDRALRDLQLAEEPKKKAEAIRTANEKKVRDLFQKARDGDLDFAKVREEQNKLRKDLLTAMKAVLTAEQFKQFEKALEREPPPPRGGPRGRGGRGFGPGRPPGR